MSVTFRLNNNKFDGGLMLSINGQTQKLSAEQKEVRFDIGDTKDSTVNIERIPIDTNEQIKTPFFKYVLFIIFLPLIWLICTLNFFLDNQNGISVHKFFYGEEPFIIFKSFKLTPNDGVISVSYAPPRYDKLTKTYSIPDLTLINADVKEEITEIKHDNKRLTTDFRVYHYPAYFLLFVIIAALNSLMIYALIKQFNPFDLFGVLGMGFCVFVMIALLIAFICIFISTHRLYKQVTRNINNTLDQ